MSAEPTRIIVSDLHLGCGDAFDIFQASSKTSAFEAFVEACAARAEPVELIINGDFVDFLQLKPWEGVGDRRTSAGGGMIGLPLGVRGR